MALRTLIFGTDDLYPTLKPYYDKEVELGHLEITTYAVFENGGITLLDGKGNRGRVGENPVFDLVIISSLNNFYDRMKFVEAQGFPRNRIIDGRAFQEPNLDLLRLINERVAYGTFNKKYFGDTSCCIYPRVCLDGESVIKFGTKSYIGSACIEGDGFITVDNFSSIAWNILFNLVPAKDHNYHNVGTYALLRMDWQVPDTFYPPQDKCRISIGSDVWIGRGCNLKCTNPNKSLIIGDGAVIASDSVVVKNVPPYAIVGGNPAKIIKFRFSEDVIESLLRIKWWNWSLDKIHDNFKYFNDVEKFISMHDK